MSTDQALEVLERARQDLNLLGITRPNAEQIVLALFGGPIDTPTGGTQLHGALPQNGNIPMVQSEVVLSSPAPKQLDLSQAVALATQHLAALGIINPTVEQLRAALLGGIVATPNGAVALTGVVAPLTASSATGGGIPNIPSPLPSYAPLPPGASPSFPSPLVR
jgi:hypothetical protein